MSKIEINSDETVRFPGVHLHTFIDSDEFSIPFAVTAHRHFNGTWRACFIWHQHHDRRLRDNLLFCFKIWARTELQISDLKRIQFFAAKIDDAGQVSRFKAIGAHRDLGHLFPVFFLPLAIAKLVKPAAHRLQREISGKTLKAANDNA